MTTIHDDLPHPVPPMAFLKYKENYFFIIVAPESDVFGMAHFNHEPGFDRARMSCNLSVKGQVYNYSNTIPFPENYELSRELGDGKLTLAFAAPHQQFDMALNSDELALNISFTKKHPTFDYSACRTAAPENISFQESMTLGLNLPYNHQQQALFTNGSVTIKASGETVAIKGYGYRDHSWCMRSDNLVLEHDWCGINFPDRAFGIKTIATRSRPGVRAKEGYTVDAEGPRALRVIDTERLGKTDQGLPEKLIHHVADVFGAKYTIEHDVGNRLAQVSLVSEAPSKGGGYRIYENFCRSVIRETGEQGFSLVELGVAYD